MDRTKYPFTQAIKRHRDEETFAVSKFPISGACQPLRAISMSVADKKIAESWEGSSAWFGDKLSQTWNKDVVAEEKARMARAAAERERERIAKILPRAITGDELSTFGVKGRGKEAQIKKAYRSVSSTALLSQLPPHEAPERPEMLKPKNSCLDRKFRREWILVPRDELEELNKLESLLRKESTHLSAQAALTINRAGLSVVEPLPMSKLAVEDVCNRQMNKARKEVESLSKQRFEKKLARNKKRLGYDKAHNGGYGEKIYKVTVVPKSKHMSKIGHSSKATSTLNTLNDSSIKTIGILNDGADSHSDLDQEGGEEDIIASAMKTKRGTYQTLLCTKLKSREGASSTASNLLAYKSIEARSIRWLEMQRIEESKIGAIEREEMEFEEKIQRHADVYTEASERKLDYQVTFFCIEDKTSTL